MNIRWRKVSKEPAKWAGFSNGVHVASIVERQDGRFRSWIKDAVVGWDNGFDVDGPLAAVKEHVIRSLSLFGGVSL